MDNFWGHCKSMSVRRRLSLNFSTRNVLGQTPPNSAGHLTKVETAVRFRSARPRRRQTQDPDIILRDYREEL
mgnify:CR=1 FL=1